MVIEKVTKWVKAGISNKGKGGGYMSTLDTGLV